MSSGAIPAKSDGSQLKDAMTYEKLVSSLQYLTMTRLDISFLEINFSNLCPSIDTRELALKCLLRYLKGTIQFGLTLVKPECLQATLMIGTTLVHFVHTLEDVWCHDNLLNKRLYSKVALKVSIMPWPLL